MESDEEHWTSGRQLLLQRCKNRALACLNEHEYKRAFAHFIVALTVQPSAKGEILNVFLYTLDKITSDLEADHEVNEILTCYQQALDVLPCDSHVLHGLASTLYRLGYVECAASYFLKSYQANPFFTPSLYCMENLKNALVERWHFVMLNDSDRNRAYQAAIKKVIDSGYKTVLDIGAGTGIFSMAALDAGADKVYACEGSEIMSAVLQSVTEANQKSLQVITKFSTEINIPEDIPERVSLVVTEIFDAGLFGENSLETLDHAWENLLLRGYDCETPRSENGDSNSDSSPSSDSSCDMNSESSNVSMQTGPNVGKVIPYSATVYAVPVECKQFRQCFRLDDIILKALDIQETVVPQFLEDEPYSTENLSNVHNGYKMLSSPSVLLDANFNSPQDIKSLLQGKNFYPTFNCTKDGIIDAFVVWFDLHLDDKITISTAPNSQTSNCWEQAVFYALPQNLKGSSVCKIGDIINTDFLCQGHLSLQNIEVSNQNQENMSSQKLVMDPSLIYLLNSYATGNTINLNLKDISDVVNACILDISTFPALSLKALRDTSSMVTVLRTQYQNEVEQFQNLYGIPSERLVFTSYEDLYKTKMQCDYLLIDPVEMCGLLKKNLLEDIMMLRLRCLKDSGLVIPGGIEISAILVESSDILKFSKVISDEKTLDYKIGQIMNAYQCRIHQDIQFSTLTHKKLSKPITLTDINLNNKSDQDQKTIFNNSYKTCEAEIINDGQVHAIIYWFTLKYNQGYSVDTSDPESLWKQAACIVDGDVSVHKGDKIQLQWSLKNSCLQIGFYDTGSSVLN